MFSFSEVASDDSFIESKGLIYPHKLHMLPTSELKVSQQDLVSLWNLAASILDNPVWYTHLINVSIFISLPHMSVVKTPSEFLCLRMLYLYI